MTTPLATEFNKISNRMVYSKPINYVVEGTSKEEKERVRNRIKVGDKSSWWFLIRGLLKWVIRFAVVLEISC